MKTNNSIKASLFLFAILFSFSFNAYNSLKQFSNIFDASLKKVHINAPLSNNITSDTIIFEELENENDNEDLLTDAFLTLPFQHLAFNAFENKTFSNFTKIPQKAVEPIFISVRSLLI